MHFRIILVFIIALLQGPIYGQELNLNVRINAPNIKLVDVKILKNLERDLQELMNNTTWTDDSFEDEERIEGSIQVNILEEMGNDNYVADIYLSASRPVFGSTYYSPLINHVDRAVVFNYRENNAVRDNRNTFTDNLSAVFTFYAYTILGFDYDSFSPMGGQPHFQIAQNVINSIPVSGTSDPNWSSTASDRTRYWMLNNIMDANAKAYRQAFYEYHRLGLDVMQKEPEKGRAVALSAITSLEGVNAAMPNSMIIQMFSNAKRTELIEVFLAGNKGERKKVYDIMAKLDPAQISQFADLKNAR